jgi:hypothetical protein
MTTDTPTVDATSTVRRSRRRRRPTGAPPPLPRSIGTSGKIWLITSIVLIVWLVVTRVSPRARRVTDRVDATILRQIARIRTGALTDVANGVDRIGSGWTITVIGIGLLVAIVVFKRWHHLFTFLGSVVVVEIVGQTIYQQYQRPRPYDVTTIGRWAGFSLPAAPIAVATFVAVGIVYSLVPAGRPRTIAKAVVGVAVLTFAAADLYLATFHPFDILVGVTLAVAVPLAAFRMYTPSEFIPVRYGGGKTAHLDVTGRRGDAIRQAMHDQLGVTVTEIKPVGLEGSGGSTPLRLRVQGDPDTYMFGKLYAMSHVRADRLYKIGRTILYGRLEDETPFTTVRRLAEYEDYTLRLMQDVGIRTAAPVGIVEMTPEREYMLVTEFIDNAREIGDAEVDDAVIDEGLTLIRQLWDNGLAHRDVKPANLLVRDGHLVVIDVAFAQVRPSPWRQAVDLANMMLVLAVRTDPDRVYEHALRFFTPDEIAEAFAAARGVASPSQLRVALKRDGRNLIARFRELAPERRPIALQRWSFRRVFLALALAVVGVFAVTQTFGMLSPAHDLPVTGMPECGDGKLMILMAQSVPSATKVPCIASVPSGWSLGGVNISRHHGKFWLDSDTAGSHAVEVELVRPRDCSLRGASEVTSDEVGTRRFERPQQLPPDLRSTRTYRFPGGCALYRFAFDGGRTAPLLFDVEQALSFQDREELVDVVHARNGLRLCGAGAPCAGGS